jgi:hypothetical protein
MGGERNGLARRGKWKKKTREEEGFSNKGENEILAE